MTKNKEYGFTIINSPVHVFELPRCIVTVTEKNNTMTYVSDQDSSRKFAAYYRNKNSKKEKKYTVSIKQIKAV